MKNRLVNFLTFQLHSIFHEDEKQFREISRNFSIDLIHCWIHLRDCEDVVYKGNNHSSYSLCIPRAEKLEQVFRGKKIVCILFMEFDHINGIMEMVHFDRSLCTRHGW